MITVRSFRFFTFFHRYSPMDLSKNPETDSTSEMDDDEDDDDDDISSENDNHTKSIPSSFSIRNLSKPHVVDAATPTTATTTTTTAAATPQGLSEMREYAMNTMRELLGIYGLTSEVAESISRQLPIAAFSSGEFPSFHFRFVRWLGPVGLSRWNLTAVGFFERGSWCRSSSFPGNSNW